MRTFAKKQKKLVHYPQHDQTENPTIQFIQTDPNRNWMDVSFWGTHPFVKPRKGGTLKKNTPGLGRPTWTGEDKRPPDSRVASPRQEPRLSPALSDKAGLMGYSPAE